MVHLSSMPRSRAKSSLSNNPSDIQPAFDVLEAMEALGTLGEGMGDLDGLEESLMDEALFRLPETIPVLPMRDAIYFPGMVFPLFVGRERSIKALESVWEGAVQTVLLVTQRDASREEPSLDELYTIGVLAEVIQFARMPDGTVRATMEAGPRVRIREMVETEPFLRVRAEMFPGEGVVEEIDEETRLRKEALARSVTLQFERLALEGRTIPPESVMNVLSLQEPDLLTDAILPYLAIKIVEKQELLEMPTTLERLERLTQLLERELQLLAVQMSIRSQVEKEMGENQREFFLREQLKVIQQELRDLGEKSDEIGEYREKILASGMNESLQQKALKEVERLEKTAFASPESGVIRTYLDWLIAMPWESQTTENSDILAAEKILNDDHYGLEKVKERLLEFLSVRTLAGDRLKSPILCFVGPPGVGKTSLGKSVAKALGRKFLRISLGGVRDEAEIRGHRRTYVGAMPGRLIQGIKQVGVRNPVVLLDEIDKIGQDFRGTPASALLEALDPEQNKEFTDHYLEAPFDLSQVLFLVTANLLEPIPPALRDRLEIIPFSSYTEEEKRAIAQTYLWPKLCESHGIEASQVTLTDDALKIIIREYTREAGVRQLERELATLLRKVARAIASGDKSHTEITPEVLSASLGASRYPWGRMEETDEVGLVTGLVYTEAGGDTIAIEVLLTHSFGEAEGRLMLTGQLGDVMKESAQTAWSFVKSRLDTLGVPTIDTKSKDIHLHVPAGAIPKDGPSAGITIATALASAFSGRPVRHDLAMTGEITLRGKILPVGGVKEKVLAAHRAGITEILLPTENEKDLEEVPLAVRSALKITFVAHVDAVFAIALNTLSA
jgi:ATP-dependent Lon protease